MPPYTLGKGLVKLPSGLVSTGPGISWTGSWYRVAVTSLYKQCGWIKIAREVFAARQLFSRAIMRAVNGLMHTTILPMDPVVVHAKGRARLQLIL